MYCIVMVFICTMYLHANKNIFKQDSNAVACKQYSYVFSISIQIYIYESDPIKFKIYTYVSIRNIVWTKNCRVDNSNYFDYSGEYYLV